MKWQRGYRNTIEDNEAYRRRKARKQYQQTISEINVTESVWHGGGVAMASMAAKHRINNVSHRQLMAKYGGGMEDLAAK